MELDMTYNSQEEILIIPEYGRHIQNMINHAKKLVDLNERQEFCEQIINLMHQMNPQNKNVQEYRVKLWKHLYRIAEYDINIAFPEGVTISKEAQEAKPDKVSYPVKDSSYRHYGHNVKILIEKAIKMEDGPIKDGFVETIASFMKMAYKNWNKEHYVSDEIVLADLKSMSNGQLSVADNTSLDTLAHAVRNKRRRPERRNNDNRRNNNRGRNNNRRSNNNHRRR